MQHSFLKVLFYSIIKLQLKVRYHWRHSHVINWSTSAFFVQSLECWLLVIGSSVRFQFIQDMAWHGINLIFRQSSLIGKLVKTSRMTWKITLIFSKIEWPNTDTISEFNKSKSREPIPTEFCFPQTGNEHWNSGTYLMRTGRRNRTAVLKGI